VPTTKPVTDFHRQDVTHAGRTEKRRGDSIMNHLYAIILGVMSQTLTQIFIFSHHRFKMHKTL
ncbi:hypothetical protein, partial [Staphylococcus felis]|uniref:hypothetical protein n=1 Tax=Staphylococcus felis TaxID=46127 RepID=UPI003967993A